ncbi:tRNAse Z4 [Wolffia australiana]
MPQIGGIRLLLPTGSPAKPLSSSSNLFRFSFAASLGCRLASDQPKHRQSVIIWASSSSSNWRGRKSGSFLPRRKSSSASDGDISRKNDRRPPEMEFEGAMFNKKRAEGLDRSSKPKNLQLKVRKLNPVSTICYVQILGTGMDTQDTSPSVLLFFDKQRFIFNAGEGLQRFCTEHKIKLSKIDHMFLTRVSSETAGGLPGLLLTLAGIGEEGMSVNIWGPSDLKYLVEAMRSFIPNAAMVHTNSFGSTNETNKTESDSGSHISSGNPIVLIDDEVVKISAFLLHPSFPSPQADETRSGLKPGDISVVYACELSEIKGKFDPVKAQALGLKPGPKYRDLQLGKSVKSDRLDIMIHPSDVLDPSIPGPIVLLIDCPTEAHLEVLLGLQSLNPYYTDFVDQSDEVSRSVNCVIHLGPSSVTKKASYQSWMKRFGRARHIMAGHEIKNSQIPIIRSSARITSRLNYLCPRLFPTQGFWPVQEISCGLQDLNTSTEDSSPTVCETIPAENLLKFNLRPYTQLGLDKSAIPSCLTATGIINELITEIPEIEDASKSVNKLWESSSNSCLGLSANESAIEEPWMTPVNGFSSHSSHDPDVPSCLENITREDMEVVLLGTGSSQPSKYRNVSSVYVNLFSKGSILLDCGEGTLGQLKRRFGMKGADDAVKALNLIWISHIHADHHTGLARILALRANLLRGLPHEPLLVIGPRPLKRFLDAYSRLEDLDMQFLDCRNTTAASPEKPNSESSLFSKGSRMESCWRRPGSLVDSDALTNLSRALTRAGLEALVSVPVVHCPQAFGVVLAAAEKTNSSGKTIPGWKMVYSGDTRPCQAIVDAARDATILIHEATFEDGLEEEALARNHSTTMEAVNVGTRAGAYRIVLTHFSQRYPKIPVFDEKHMKNTCIGFDMMSVNLADLTVLPRVLPFVKLLFKNEMALDDSEEALRLIKFAVPKSGTDFRREMQRNSTTIRQLFHYKGYPDPLKGDALNKAVRDTAHEAISALFSAEDSKAPVETTKKRMEGFGSTNFDPRVEDKKSFLSEVVELGSASLKQGLNSIAAAHSLRKNDNGSYKSPQLHRSLTTETDNRDRYEGDGQKERWTPPVNQNKEGSSSWTQDSTASSDVSLTNGSNNGDKSREERLLETIVTSSGVRLQPTRDAIQVFLSQATKLSPITMSSALESKLQSHLWQVRMKAICVLESILRSKEDAYLSAVRSYFVEHGDCVVKCSESPQATLRDKAYKVLSLLNGDSASGVKPDVLTSAKTPVPLPDLIDTGESDLLGNDDNALRTTQPGVGLLVDDLFGPGSTPSESESTVKHEKDDPFADVSFHVADEGGQPDDIFADLAVEQRKPAGESDGSNLVDFFVPGTLETGKNQVNDLMAGLTVEDPPQTKASATGQPSSMGMTQSPLMFPLGSAPYGVLPPGMMLSQQFPFPLQQQSPTMPLGYAAAGGYVPQTQLLFPNFGQLSGGVPPPSGAALPDIFQLSNSQAQARPTVTSIPKEDTRAFDFISDHVSAARNQKRLV